jgi:peptidoglycan hydrolase-like protein with peptidoglycan-binding domain
VTRRRIAALGGAVAVAAASAGIWATRDGNEPAAAPLAHGKLMTVQRRTLVDRTSEDGTLGYAGAAAVLARASGTVTWLPAVGDVVRPGQRLIAVDGKPVYLMDGAIPAWRAFKGGMSDGEDVRQLETNLSRLGYDPSGAMTVDDHFSAATAAAVRRWQKARGLTQTGHIDLGQVVFLRGGRRVSKRDVALGSEIGGGGASAGAGGPTAVLETTSTKRQVTVNLEADKVSLARRGATVTVTLPDGSDVRGRITKVATVAQEQQSGGGDGSTTTVIPVYIRLDRRARPPRLDAAPVSVAFARERRKNVLTVPVTALLALRGGRYAVEAVEGAMRRTITVTPGLFAEGYVEIEGRGIHEGMRVVGGE